MNLNTLIGIVFPPLCVSCGRAATDGAHVCDSCLGSVFLNTTLFCGRCRARLPEGKKICHYDHPFVLGAATDYSDDVMQRMVHALKFKFIKNLGSALGGVISGYANQIPDLKERLLSRKQTVVVPIPLSSQRLRERGFNQSEEIAREFAAQFSLPLIANCLKRTRHTKAQSETKRIEERKQNIEGCFSVQHPEVIIGKTVFLIDDVITSGATSEEAADVLKNSGAKEVIVLVAAKA